MIKIYTDTREVMYDSFTFNGGEEHVKIKTPVNGMVVLVQAHVKNSGDFIKLAMIKDALERLGAKEINLVMPYVPYARQDRVCSYGEAFAVKIMANMLNQMEFNNVIIHDPHSDVTPALINNVTVIDQHNIAYSHIAKALDIKEFKGEFIGSFDNTVVVAPDAGASKKSEKLAEKMKVLCHQALKTRDPNTGKLSGFKFCGDKSDIEGKHIVVPDDICDGGGTFIGLGEVLKELNPKSMTLYITHGIFSNSDNYKKLEELFDNIVVAHRW